METHRTHQAEPDAAKNDSFLTALAAAELDDEPYTDEQRATVEEGWQDYLAGRSIPWEDLRRSLILDEEAL